MESYYDLLDVAPTVTTEEINAAYRRGSQATTRTSAHGEKMKRLNDRLTRFLPMRPNDVRTTMNC